MGQYYKVVNLDTKQVVSHHVWDNGVKLMEHSWVGNSFMKQIENYLAEGGKWHKTRIVWAGDYMDDGLFMDGFENIDDEKNLYSYANRFEELTEKLDSKKSFKYLINHTKKEFINVGKCIPVEVDKNWSWTIHPLSLLTSSGNGRGGGDFRGENLYVGTWAGDIISTASKKPSKEFKELETYFVED